MKGLRAALGILLLAWISLIIISDLQAQERSHEKLYQKVKDSVVGVRALALLGERSCTGIVLDKEGYILTSRSVVPPDAQRIRVWLPGAKFRQAQVIGSVIESELTLIKVDPKGLELKPMTFGDSASVKVGEVAYTLGNVRGEGSNFYSIIDDDMPALSHGIISGVYKLKEARADSTYVGTVLESSAAVNQGMEGAPLLNGKGEMVGFITLNFSVNRWLGVAIPINVIKSDIEQLMKKGAELAPDDTPDNPSPKGGKGYLGVKVKEQNSRLVVTAVDKGSPAEKAGITEGDVVLEVTETSVTTEKAFWEKLDSFTAGSIVWLKLDIDGTSRKVKVTLDKQPQ